MDSGLAETVSGLDLNAGSFISSQGRCLFLMTCVQFACCLDKNVLWCFSVKLVRLNASVRVPVCHRIDLALLPLYDQTNFVTDEKTSPSQHPESFLQASYFLHISSSIFFLVFLVDISPFVLFG